MKLTCHADIGHIWFGKLWNERDESVAHDLMTPDCRAILEGNQEIVGPDDFLKFQRTLLTTVPDLHINVIDTVGDAEDVCVHWKATGTHSGNGMGLAPTGTSLDFHGVTWFKLVDGKVVGGRDFWNLNALLEILSGRPATVAT